MDEKVIGFISGSHRAHVACIDREIAMRCGRRAKTVSAWRTGHYGERPQVKVAECLETCFALGERGAAHQFLHPVRAAIWSAPDPERIAALQYLTGSPTDWNRVDLPRVA